MPCEAAIIRQGLNLVGVEWEITVMHGERRVGFGMGWDEIDGEKERDWGRNMRLRSSEISAIEIKHARAFSGFGAFQFSLFLSAPVPIACKRMEQGEPGKFLWVPYRFHGVLLRVSHWDPRFCPYKAKTLRPLGAVSWAGIIFVGFFGGILKWSLLRRIHPLFQFCIWACSGWMFILRSCLLEDVHNSLIIPSAMYIHFPNVGYQCFILQ